MNKFTKNIRPFVLEEIREAVAEQHAGNAEKSFSHLENAHILGQESTYLHVLVHVRMARWAVRQKDLKELTGQILRIVGAATKTAIGLVPIGNTGGANISPFKPLPLREEHSRLIAQAKEQ